MKWHKHAFTIWSCLILALSCRVEAYSIPESDVEAGCFAHGVRYKFGDTWPGPPGDCKVYKCTGYYGSYSAKTCAQVGVRPGSKCFILPGIPHQQYPNCCPKAVCPDDQN